MTPHDRKVAEKHAADQHRRWVARGDIPADWDERLMRVWGVDRGFVERLR